MLPAEAAPADAPAGSTRRQGIKFDPTIQLSHIFTFVGLLAVGAGMWSSMDKRVTILEVYSTAQHATDNRQDGDLSEAKQNNRRDLEQINSKLDRLIEKSGGTK